jgi:hypothetical protein
LGWLWVIEFPIFDVLARGDVVSRPQIDVDEPGDAELFGDRFARTGA